ncbi:hypothetical protein HN789_02540 [archaeon]|nr:hypothetical protein [Candidatus Woesearchaeota archaeon]MBT3465458.1 hypothetical protein [archaeon]MBT3720785.1 hypothetical protein [archaeon]MBT4460788.1 hypothetical protein [archaeon]MBT4858356.1 hypothetical protein [archaeon]
MNKKFAISGVVIIILISSLVIGQVVIKEDALLKDPKFYLSLGDFFMKKGYASNALSMYEKALELSPENTATLNNLGFYYKEINPLLAEDYFNKALEIDPEYELARNNLALLFNSLENYEQAAYHLKFLVDDYPDNINYNYDYAINVANVFYYKSNSYEDLQIALKHFKIVYEMDPNFNHVLDNIKVLNEMESLY